MANQTLAEFTEKTFVADADWTFVWDTAGAISKKVSRNAFLSGTTADFHLGLADAAAPVAQTLSVQSVVAGTTNTAGQAFTIDGSRGTGTGAGGHIIFRVARPGTSGSAQNPLTEGLRISTDVHPSGGLGISSAGGNNLFLYYPGGGGIFFGNASNQIYGGFNTLGNFRIGDTGILINESTNTLALRNSTAAQTFNVYGTWTTAITNFERLAIKYNASDLAYQIAAEKGSTNGDYRPLQLWTGGASRLAITTAGNVGIGTTAPSQKLEVWGNSAGTISKVTSVSPGTASVLWLDGPVGQVVTSTGSLFLTNQSGTGNIIFETVSSEKMRLQNNGNLGIGTTAPSSKLHVNGAIIQKPDASATPPANGDLVVEATSNTTLTFKLKGTDGTVRSGTITLA